MGNINIESCFSALTNLKEYSKVHSVVEAISPPKEFFCHCCPVGPVVNNSRSLSVYLCTYLSVCVSSPLDTVKPICLDVAFTLPYPLLNLAMNFP